MLDFPANPTIGQVFASGGVTWIWDGAKWTLSAVAGGGTSITIGDLPPTDPAVGALWWHSASGQLYVFYNDGNSSQWVPTTNQMGGGYATTAYVDAARLGDNRIINGDMRIDQRNNGASGSAINTYTIDRWMYGASKTAKMTWGQNLGAVATTPGFPYYLGVKTTAAVASPAATDYFQITQPIEADMISDFAWGTVNTQPQPVTLSFWAYSSLIGLFSGSIVNFGGTRSYCFQYSLPTANTWTKIVISIPAEAGGTWVMSGNGGAAILSFDLGAGTTYRGPANVWGSNGFNGVTGSVSVVSTLNATFYVTGVKLEIGSVATPFNRQSLAKSMADCQRYYQTFQYTTINAYAGAGAVWSSFFPYQVAMRAGPTVTFPGVAYGNASGLVNAGSTPFSTQTQLTITTAGLAYANFTLTLSAEL